MEKAHNKNNKLFLNKNSLLLTYTPPKLWAPQTIQFPLFLVYLNIIWGD